MSKTLKLKSPEPTIAAKPAAPAEGGEGIYVSSRHRNPMEMADAAPVKKEKWAWAAVLAIFSTLLFLVLCVLEYMDWEALTIA